MIEAPEPTPLDLPLGDADGLEDVVEDVAGAAYWLTVLASDLTGPAASAPGWLGVDAAAAAAQVGAVAGLARECSRAVGAAAHRLRLHHDLLVDVRRRVSALREEQQDDFRVMWQRLSRIEDPQLAVMVDAPERVAAIEEVRAGEASRRRRHAALLEELADDAAATAGVLAESSRVVGGSGTRGDGERVLAYLAAELPGWGERELRAQGRAVARDFLGEGDTWLSPEERETLARRVLALAGSPVFAKALLLGLGVDGVRETLAILGDGAVGSDSALAQLFATAFGAAQPDGPTGDRLAQVLDADYVGDGVPWLDPDIVLYGMGAVLAASSTLRSGGLRPPTVVEWARQIVAREQAVFDVPRELRVQPTTGAPVDALDAAVRLLGQLGDPASAATLLSDLHAWPILLGRSWQDGGAALAEMVALAGAEAGRDGAAATRRGLEALGAGLGEDGDPEEWQVDRDTAAAVSPALASGVAQHVTVATGVLGLGVDGDLRGRATDIMRGLGYLTLDADAARTVGTALHEWVRTQPTPDLLAGGPMAPQVVVPSAFLAVREYGQRLDFALHGFEQQAEAERRERTWNWTIGLLVEIPKSAAVGAGLGLVEGYAAMALGFDGRWDNGKDGGLHFDRDRAAGAVLTLAPTDAGVRQAMADQARAVFDRTLDALGGPKPPVSPELDLLAPVKELAEDATLDLVDDRTDRGRSRWRGPGRAAAYP
jgi:hypothetical protein